MLCDSEYLLRCLILEIEVEDAYGLKGTSPELIVDIGANCGVFSLYARKTFPGVPIVAFEPYPPTNAMLVKNVEGADIRTFQLALGVHGGSVNFALAKDSGSNQTRVAADPKDAVPSMSLPGLLATAGISVTPKTFIKVDCEGAEKHLRDPASVEILRSAGWVGMEYHLGGPRSPFPEGMSGDEFNAWMADLNKGHLLFTAKRYNRCRGAVVGRPRD